MIYRYSLLIFLLSLNFIVLNAQSDKALTKLGIAVEDGVPSGLNIGDNAPDFTAYDQNGNQVMLSQLLKKGKVILNFYRGAWCPVCNKYMSEFQDAMPAFIAKNAQVISVSPETNEGIEKFSKKTNLSNIIITDTDNAIMELYEVLFSVTKGYQRKIRTFLFTDIAKHNEQETAMLPIPATYIIEQDGTISYVHFDLNYKERAPISEILENL